MAMADGMMNCGSRFPANPSFVYLKMFVNESGLREGGQCFCALNIYPVPTSITQAGNGPDIVEQLNFRLLIGFTVLNANFVWFLMKKTTPKTECVTTLFIIAKPP